MLESGLRTSLCRGSHNIHNMLMEHALHKNIVSLSLAAAQRSCVSTDTQILFMAHGSYPAWLMVHILQGSTMPPGHQLQHALPTDSFPIVTEAWGDVRGLSEPNNIGNGNFLPDIRDAPTSRGGMRPGLFGGFVREVQSPDHLRSEARIRSLKNELKNLQHRFEAEVQVWLTLR